MKRFSVYALSVLSLMLSGVFFVACDDDDDSNGKLTFDKEWR